MTSERTCGPYCLRRPASAAPCPAGSRPCGSCARAASGVRPTCRSMSAAGTAITRRRSSCPRFSSVLPWRWSRAMRDPVHDARGLRTPIPGTRLASRSGCSSVVRRQGLEPACLSALEPKSSASTNSATFAASRMLSDGSLPDRPYTVSRKRAMKLRDPLENPRKCRSATTRTSRSPRGSCRAPCDRPVAAIYRFARTADDFADEGDAPAADRLARLDAYRADLDRIAAGREPDAPVLAELAPVIAAHALAAAAVSRPARRVRQDVVKQRYADLRRGARLLPPLRQPGGPPAAASLRRGNRARTLRRSDAICTGAAARQLLAGRGGRLAQGPRLPAAGRARAVRRRARRRLPPARCRRRLAAPDARSRSSARARCSSPARRSAARSPAASAGDPPRRAGGLAHPRADRPRGRRRVPAPPGAAGARLVAHVLARRGHADDAGRVLPAEGGGERIELLLLVPLPAAGAAPRDHRALRVLPRGGRRRRRVHRRRRRARRSSPGGGARSPRSSPATPQHPVTQALAAGGRALRRHAGAAERDHRRHGDGSPRTTRYPDFAGLERYCYRVAGVVGLLAAGIFGYANPQTLEYAETLGIAFQLTNIIRDVGEDARKDRIYLPQDELAAVRRLGRRHPQRAADRGFRPPDGVPDRPREGLLRARARAAAAPRTARRSAPASIMAAIYRTLLDEIRRDGSRVLAQRVALTPMRKLWIAWRTWVAA